MKRITSSAARRKPQAAGLPAVLAGLVFGLAMISCARDQSLSHYGMVADKIRKMGLTDEKAYEFLRRITDVGPRLTASPEAAAAVDLTRKMMEGMGFDNVHLEPITVNRWVRGAKEEAKIICSGEPGAISLSVTALGGSIGTPGSGITAPVVEVRSFEELDRLGTGARGKLVFFNRPMDRTQVDPFAAYGGAADQRVSGAVHAARLGAAAVLVRSLTFRIDDEPHTGVMSYSSDVPKIPAAAVSTTGAETLSALLKNGKSVSVFLKMSCENLPPVPSANVVGEITGSESPHDIILVGGHLDSWDLGTGAHDDGAGCAASLEALRLLKDLGLRPKRTIRAVLFMDEEFGGTGGRFYVFASQRKGERHLVAMESDRGGFLPVGIAADRTGGRVLRRLRACADLFRPLGITSIGPGGGGVDVGPLVKQGAVPVAVIRNAQPYFDVHHSALDVLSRVHPRELEIQAIILATLAYVLAQVGI
ncbi:MAG: M20/M25/M40 family metallo-hydrolase [Candidatus Aminicenantales bacterium]